MKQRTSQILIAALLACLCLGSIVAAPMNHISGCCLSDVFGVDKENDNPVDSNEFEDDLFLQNHRTQAPDMQSSASNPKGLSLQNMLSAPLSPPPEYL